MSRRPPAAGSQKDALTLVDCPPPPPPQTACTLRVVKPDSVPAIPLYPGELPWAGLLLACPGRDGGCLRSALHSAFCLLLSFKRLPRLARQRKPTITLLRAEYGVLHVPRGNITEYSVRFWRSRGADELPRAIARSSFRRKTRPSTRDEAILSCTCPARKRGTLASAALLKVKDKRLCTHYVSHTARTTDHHYTHLGRDVLF